MIYIERNFDGIKVDKFDGNTEGFLVETSDNATFDLSENTMKSDVDYSEVGGKLGCKEGTSPGVSVRAVEGITEGTMLDLSESSLAFSSLGIFDWGNVLYLDCNITLRKVINYELHWIFLNPVLM